MFAFAEGNLGCTGPGCGNDLVAYLLVKNLENAAQEITVRLTTEDGRMVKQQVILQPQQRGSIGLHMWGLGPANFTTEAYFPRRGYAGLQMRSLARFFDPDAAQFIPAYVECVAPEEVP